MVNDVINDICYNGCDILLCVMVIKDVKIDGYDIYVYIKVILNIYINGWCLCVDIIWYYLIYFVLNIGLYISKWYIIG